MTARIAPQRPTGLLRLLRPLRPLRLMPPLLALLVSTGCWDIKTVQDINYVTALGFDYKDGKYIVHVQMLNLSNVAKQEGNQVTGPGGVWVGQASGDNVLESMYNIYKSAQQAIYWGHVSSLVLTEEVLKQGLGSYIFDGLVRFREIRPTLWVFSTKESLENVLTVRPFFNLSPLSSILHQPGDNYSQRTSLEPIMLYKLMRNWREPGHTSVIPTLSISKQTWYQDNKPDPKLMLSGMHVVEKGSMKLWASEERLTGFKWLQPSANRILMPIAYGANSEVSVSLTNLDHRIILEDGSGSPVFRIKLHGDGRIAESDRKLNIKLLEEKTEEQIEREIRDTLNDMKQRGVDIYSLEDVLYRQSFTRWKSLTDTGRHPLAHYEVGAIEIDVRLRNSGMYKNRNIDEREY